MVGEEVGDTVNGMVVGTSVGGSVMMVGVCVSVVGLTKKPEERI